MDPDYLNLNNFANSPPDYYTSTPGGTNWPFHPQAGDLQTLAGTTDQGLGNLLSMLASGHGINTGPAAMAIRGLQQLPPREFRHINPVIQAQAAAKQQAFAPATFVHQGTGYEAMDQDGSPMYSHPPEGRITSIGSACHSATPTVAFQHSQLPPTQISHPPRTSAEKFHFHSTLNAPTAMIKLADEIPVTYLNKGQVYSLSIVGMQSIVAPVTMFRTVVRISFEDDEQQKKPGVCWRAWKEGRGASEVHQRGGKLHAVEYVEVGQPAEGDDKRTRVQLEKSSFDGFSVTWTPGSQDAPEANIAIRFNFLSSDFSHSKGVKGIPLRLCAKTLPVKTAMHPHAGADLDPEIRYCKAKLFRDHGAERKLSNDVAHVKKSIDKVKHQIAQAKSGLKDFGKKKRGRGKPKKGDPERVGKVQKHKRTWSMPSTSHTDGGGGGSRTTVEHDVHIKQHMLQQMFTSTRPVSVLYLSGEGSQCGWKGLGVERSRVVESQCG
jgi:hypothetical protein